MTAADPVLKWKDAQRSQIVPGITMAVAAGEQLSAAHYVLGPDAVVPEHAHDNEEYGHVLRGALRLRHGGNDVLVKPGEGFLIPGGEPHSAVAAAAGCELLECYAPPRLPAAPPKEKP